MLHRIPMICRLAAALLAAALGAIPLSWAAPADDLKEAQRLYGQQKLQPALDKIEVYLRAMPRDPQGRFLKGLILTEQKRVPEAIQVFTGLTEDFPELPEPYNNLAVLYASQGNYDKAKSALELAIHTHPSYATAHENLGDIYAQLASRAYDRALQLDKTNTTAQLKLAMVKDLFSSQKLASAGAQRPEPAKAPPAVTAPSAKAEMPKPEPVKAEPPKPAPPPAEAKPAPPAASIPPASAPAADNNKAQVIDAIESWAKAWSAKDVRGYLMHYAVDFDVPGGASRAAWEKERTERIQRPKSIDVSVKILNAQATDNEATVTFRQSYKSDTLKTNSTKTLKLVRQGDRWLIKQERTGG
ncbi:MAG: L,D-transpeptidase Cds6 family protein [Usitatibacter sp.]